MRFLTLLLISFLQFHFAFSQDENSTTYFKIAGDSVYKKEIDLNEVVIYKPVEFSNNKERLDYFVLKRKVLKVYPYAKMASERLTSDDSGGNVQGASAQPSPNQSAWPSGDISL